MNKSKFLKKSLAAVLAVLMIVAMIPLSAAAADAPKVYVGSQQINFASGATQSVTTSEDNLSISWDYPADNKTRLFVVESNGDQQQVVDANGGAYATLDLTKFSADSNGVYTIPLLLKEEVAEGGWTDGVSYTISLTVKDTDVDLDATIKEVVGIPSMVGFSITDDKITIIMPFGTAAPTITNADHKADIFIPTSDKVTSATYTGGTPNTLKVTAPNATKTYTVEMKNQTGFATFSVPTQVGDAEIKNEGTNGTNPTIAIDVTIDTSLAKVIPTFTLGETVDYVTTIKGGNGADHNDVIRVTSGETAVNFTSDGTTGEERDFSVYLKGVATPVTVGVTLTKATDGDKASLTSIQVGDSARVMNITGTDVTVPMGVNTKYSDPIDVTVEASADANISIPSQSSVSAQDITNGTATLRNVDISGKKFTLRVTSGDKKIHTDYNITLVPASEIKTDLTDFTIKKGNDLYSARFSGLTGTINLPFSMKTLDNATRTDWKVYATPSAGATAFGQDDNAILNGTTTFDNAFATAKSTANGGFIENYEVRVAADDRDLGDTDTTRTYTIKLVFAQPKTGSLVLSGTSAVLTKDYTKINENNTLKTEVGTIKDNADHTTTLNTIELTVPNSTQDSDDNGGATPNVSNAYFSELKLSEGAKAYLVNEDDNGLIEIKGLDKKVLNAQTGINGIALDSSANMHTNVVTDKELDTTNATTKLYVVSETKVAEAEALNANVGNAMDALVTDNGAHCYYVYAVKAPAETGKSIRSISSTVDKNVTAVLSGGKIVITVPYSYANAHDDPDDLFTTEGKHCFTLTSTLSKLATMASASVNITSDYGKEYHSTNNPATRFVVKWSDAAHTSAMMYGSNGTTNAVIANTTAGDKEWVVTSEAGGTANTTSYPVTLKVAPAEKGATIKTLKVGNSTASISGTTINLNLPFGASLNPVKLDITADKMAKVFINGAEYKATNNYSLNSDVTITVTSEDTKTTNVYTLKTKVGDRFSDVKSTDWFDEYVQKAVDEGIVKGYDDGTFKPYNDITREEFALMTVRMLDVEAEAEAMKDNTLPFKDENKVSSWAKGAVAYCADKKIINGRDTGEFDPAGKITREEAAKILAVALGLDTSDTSASVFTDNARISTWARGYVNACQKRDIFGGDEAKRFNPQARITRAETAKVMVKSLEIK